MPGLEMNEKYTRDGCAVADNPGKKKKIKKKKTLSLQLLSLSGMSDSYARAEICHNTSTTSVTTSGCVKKKV